MLKTGLAIIAMTSLWGATPGSHLKKHGLPVVAKVVERDEYILAYDGRNKTAFWVIEEITAEEMHRPPFSRSEIMSQTSGDGFNPDPAIPKHLSATDADYRRSGYDRGHLAPSGDFRYDLKQSQDSFYYSNITPQPHEFNAGIWLDLENQLRQWAKEFGSLFVVTGPAFLPSKGFVKYPVIGAHDVGVPTHCFKAVLIEKAHHFEVCCFLLPSTDPNSHKHKKKAHFESYTVPLRELERLTGIIFYPNIHRDNIRDVTPSNWKTR